MKKSEFAQVKGLDVKELKDKTKGLKKEIADLILDKNMNKLKDVKMISKKKKELAQVLTVVRQKELLGELEAKIEKKEETTKESEVKIKKQTKTERDDL